MSFIIKGKNVVCLFLPIIFSIFLLACTASKGLNDSDPVDVSLQDYEKAFDPTKHELDYTETPTATDNDTKPNTTTRKNISGFRIQVVISNEFEECQQSRKELQKLFPDQKTYIVHEFPFYKLRLGNFRTRKDAESYIKNLSDNNIKSTQIVPDRIVVD